MARIIEFHIPADFKPILNSVPQGERGRLVVFPSNLGKRSWETQQMRHNRWFVLRSPAPPAIGSV